MPGYLRVVIDKEWESSSIYNGTDLWDNFSLLITRLRDRNRKPIWSDSKVITIATEVEVIIHKKTVKTGCRRITRAACLHIPNNMPLTYIYPERLIFNANDTISIPR
jgi:hypothetical protein